MTKTTTHAPIPENLATLRADYFPPEPTSSVTAALDGIARLDTLVTAAVARLADHDRQTRERATAMADAAIAGDDLDRLNVALVEGGRDIVATSVDALRTARAAAVRRHTQAQQIDPIYLGWVAECRRITDERERTKSADDSTVAMLDFVRHNAR
jgi:hypothetical protein